MVIPRTIQEIAEDIRREEAESESQGTRTQTEALHMKIWLAFIWTSTNFLVGALNMLFSSGVPLFGFLSLVIQLLPLTSWYIIQFLVSFLVSASMVKSHSLHFHTLPPGLPGWTLFTISSISRLTNNTAVSISVPFVLAQYIIPANNYWRLSAHSLDIWNSPQIFGMPDSV